MNVFLASLVAAALSMQLGGPYEVRKSVIAAGGDSHQSAAPGSSFVLMSTNGQPVTMVSSAGPFGLTGGFWAGLGLDVLFIDGFESNNNLIQGSRNNELTKGAPRASPETGSGPRTRAAR